MRRIFPALLVIILFGSLLALALAAGCTAISDPQSRQNFVADFGDAVTIRILASDQPETEARRITRAAEKIRAAAADDVTVSDLRGLLTTVAIRQLDTEDQPRARLIVDLIARRLKRRFGIDLTVVPAERLAVARQLVIDMCDMAIEVASTLQPAGER